MQPDLAHGVFLTGSDFPYTGNIPIILKRDPVTDDELTEVEALEIVGDRYYRLSSAPPLIARQNSKLVLSWDTGQTLQSATNLAGPWQTIINAESPYEWTMTESRRFFRLVVVD